MIKEPEMLQDIRDIMKIGTDTEVYVKLAAFLNELDGNYDANARKFTEGVHNLANLIRHLELT